MNISNTLEQLMPLNDPKKDYKFTCTFCNFNTCNKKDWNKHIVTIKHTKLANGEKLNNLNIDLPQKTHKNPKPIKLLGCDNCNKTYFARSGLWYHKKNCTKIIKEDENSIVQLISNNNDLPDDNTMIKLVMDIVKSNSEMQKQVLDIFKNGTINNSHNNNHNKTFNLQFFLNETCKDAVNIMDFVKDIKINVADLEDVGKLGYVNGISNIIIKNLKDMDVSKRPLHCSDIKREVLYIKDQDKWEKEDSDKEKFRYAIKHIAHKNIQMIPEWKKENPEYKLNDGYSNDQFMQLVMESMGGSDKVQEQGYQDKIISKVVKHVVIDK